MRIQRTSIQTCQRAVGTVVVIDVLRAFTTAAYALAGGAEKIVVTAGVDEALALRDQIPNAVLLGEQKGLPISGFDFSNSPSELAGVDLSGKVVVQRTTHGTQGIVRCAQADHSFAASLCCAKATARAIAALAPQNLAWVITGIEADDPADEDVACADYLEAILAGMDLDHAELCDRVRKSHLGRKFLDAALPELPAEDMEYCLAIDRFDFAMPVTNENGLFTIKPAPAP
jgi:2-phosphosulfolactate phosphatase